MTLYTEAHAASLLNIPVKTLRNARYRHKVAYVKYGKEVRYSQKHLDDYTAVCERPAGGASCEVDINSGNEQEVPTGILPGRWGENHFVEAQTRKILHSLSKS